MEPRVRIVPACIARNAVANLNHSRGDRNRTMGKVLLREHQAVGVTQILQALDEYGGALLCDEVGLGKTFTAAAVMSRHESSVVVAPAALLPMWEVSLRQAGVKAQLISVETFSRSKIAARTPELIVVDEAHHLRNSRTARFRNVAAFIGAARVLLLSATPLHNLKADIDSLLSLFLGSRAACLGPADLARCVIRRRRTASGITGFPKRVYVPAETPPASDEIRRLIIELPPPIPPRDGEECSALVQYTLLRQWASSDAALRCGLETRIARARALISALEAGRLPTRKELSAWITADMDVQLGFMELLADPGGDSALLRAVQEHERATLQVLDVLRSTPCSDEWRATHLRALRSHYGARSMVAFTQFGSTARALYRMLKSEGKVALITAGHCEIASGRVSRHDVISRFAPMGTGCAPPPEREEISLLVTTDLCSEGLNLQDAGVVVHLDLPWTPARMEQRVGRIARAGSLHDEIFVHTFAIPAIAEALLGIEERLRIKFRLSEESVGSTEEEVIRSTSIADAQEKLREMLHGWKLDGPWASPTDSLACLTECSEDCFVALVRCGTRTVLICGDGEAISDDPRNVLAKARRLTDVDITICRSTLEVTEQRITEWLEQRRLDAGLDVRSCHSSVRKQITRQIDSAAQRVPMHKRAEVGTLADA
ncbi:MAG: DEAD/DEAH box helicase, partial [Gemmatimonadaceae bacterium]|nr:DEAD/DEAH box helicase [Gemmatimonadaceae bacterium]